MNAETPFDYDVAIVGAGLSGLACARHIQLLNPGLGIAILEARNRVGGRTLSKPVGDGDGFDLGGQWVGPGQTHALRLIQELGLTLVEQPWFTADDAKTTATFPNQQGGEARPAAQCMEVTAQSAAACAAPTSAVGGQADKATHASLPTAASNSDRSFASLDPDQGHHSGHSLSSGASAALLASEAKELAVWMKKLDAMAATVSGPPTWQSCPDAELWDNQNARQFLDSVYLSRAVHRELCLFFQTVLACDPSQVSLLYALFTIHTAGGVAALADGPGGAQTWRVRGGAQQLSLGMARQAVMAGAHLMLGHVVTGIDQLRGAVAEVGAAADPDDRRRGSQVLVCAQVPGSQDAAGFSSTSSSVHLSGPCASGAGCVNSKGGVQPVSGVTIKAASSGSQEPVVLCVRRVVVALPPPLRSTLQFSPPLPACHQHLIEGVFMGAAVKVVALYAQAFWEMASTAHKGPSSAVLTCTSTSVADEPTYSPSAITIAANIVPGHLNYSPTSDHLRTFGGTTPDSGAILPVDVSTMAASTAMPRLEDLGPVANMFSGNFGGQPALIGLITGHQATMFASMDSASQQAAILEQYRQYWNSDAALSPTRFECQAWINEPFSQGCYAGLLPPGLATACGDCIKAPCGAVHWAGTECARVWVGYFEGALEAGQAAAVEVIQALTSTSASKL